MGVELNVYRVYDPRNGKFIVEGTVSECADKLNMTNDRFRKAAFEFKNGRYRKLNIYDVTDEYNKADIQKKYSDVIKAWDDFVTPIRERYGIPVRHLGEGKK